jgi:hypothetical protein
MVENNFENMEEDSLDTSWMDEVKKEISIDTNYNKEPCEQINTYFLFVDVDNHIHKISSDKENLCIGQGNTRIITKERLIQMIEAKKKENLKIKYRLANILLYCNEIEASDIRNYAKNENMEEISNNVLKVLSIFNDVVIPNSIFIFHSINAIYFIFKQIKNKNAGKIANTPVVVPKNLKSILKVKTKHAKSKIIDGEHNITKKVSFQDESSLNDLNTNEVEPIYNMNKTKKKLDDDDEDEDFGDVGAGDVGAGDVGAGDVGTGDAGNKHNKTRKL